VKPLFVILRGGTENQGVRYADLCIVDLRRRYEKQAKGSLADELSVVG